MKFYLLFCFCLILSSILYSQNVQGPKITTYTPFLAYKDTITVKRKPGYCMNVIKLNNGLIFRGALVMGYERLFTNHLSLEGELGLTYRDFLFEMQKDMDNSGDLADFNNESGGPFISVKSKFYFEDDFPDGIFISTMIRYRSYNNLRNVSDMFNDITTVKQNYNMSEAGLLIGYQDDSWYWDNTWETYFGAGFINVKYDSYNKGNNGTYSKVRKSDSYPVFFLGWTIGLPF